MTPTIGRIVHVYVGTSRTSVAALVTSVYPSNVVNLTVFPDGRAPMPKSSVTVYADPSAAADALDTGACRVAAFWPPRA